MPDQETPKKRIKPVIEEIVDETVVPSVENTETKTEVKAEEAKSEAQVVSEEKSQAPVAPPPSPMKEPFRITLGFVAIVVIVAIFVALVSGAVYVYFNGVTGLKTATTTPEPTPTPVATPAATVAPSGSATPSGSPTANASLGQYKLSILNGSGQPGTASKAAGVLKEAGFTVGNTGNASNFNFKGTTIQAKSTVPADVVKKAQDALAKTYKVSTGTAIPTSGAYDIIVTVGAE